MCSTFIYYVDYERRRGKGPNPLATCFITRYQHDKLYVDIVVKAAADLRRRRCCRNYFDDVDILTLLAERIYYLYLLSSRRIYDNAMPYAVCIY
jgi:hypothetical protein